MINGSPILGQKTRPYNYQQKKRTCKIVDFAVLADHRIQLKESEKKDKYLDLARELKKQEGDNYTNHKEEEEDCLEFWKTNGWFNSGQKTRPSINSLKTNELVIW